MKGDETWNRYCVKLEELRREQDESRKRRRVSPGAVEIPDKPVSVAEGVVVTDAGAPGGADEDAATARCGPVPRPAGRPK